MKQIILVLALSLTTTVLVGCGQKGPLFLPEVPEEVSQ